MKNNASNLPITQALRTQQVLKEQSAQLLPAMTAVLTPLGYDEICHQRLSQQDSYQYQQSSTKTINYQGLTRAQHPQFGCVMIKWALSSDVNPDTSNHSTSNLSHEEAVLYALNKSQQIQAQNNTAPILPIAPPVLAYHTLRVSVLNLNQQLTVLVMPYYSQDSLAHQLSNKKCKLLTAERKYQLIVQSAHLITTLHNRGWLHNDIKPSNILLDSFSLNNSSSNNTDYGSSIPKLLLTDFALAKRFDEGSDKYFDQEWIIYAAGTPAYLAPECWQGQGATVQSDIYAFGIMMYEILIGTRPFKIAPQSSEPLKAWALEHCQQPIPLLPREYQHYQLILKKVLAKRVERRYKSMQEVLRDLEKCSI